jgi:shikimate dehydrogenase
MAVAPENLRAAVHGLRALGYRGVNVTLPHKEAVLTLTDTLDEAAHRAQAANTLIFTDDGRIEGRNTDSYGFMENLRTGAPEWQPSAGPATVIGAGGGGLDPGGRAGDPHPQPDARTRDRPRQGI